MTQVDRSRKGSLIGILVTYRRPVELARTLDILAQQTRRLDRLIVVDNDGSSEAEAIVRSNGLQAATRVEYLALGENAGYTGGLAAGMQCVLPSALEDDWIMALDDDDPPTTPDTFARLERFGTEMIRRDPRTGGVGAGGGRFDLRRGRIVRVPTKELFTGPVEVDYLTGGHFGMYRPVAVRAAGTFSPAIFFGLSECEYGLRIRKTGFTLYADGTQIAERRASAGRSEYEMKASWRVEEPNWRHYYTLRNLIYIMRQHGQTLSAIRVAAVRGVGKPLINLPLAPKAAAGHLRLGLRACRDGFSGRMGRTIEPVPWGERPGRHRTKQSAPQVTHSEAGGTSL